MNSQGITATNPNKFLSQGATLPWKLSTAYSSNILCTGDFDGDGMDEVLVYSAQEANPYGQLSILSYLVYSELNSLLPDSSDFVVQWNSANGIPSWNYPANPAIGSLNGFSYYAADIDNDGCDEIIAFFPSSDQTSSCFGVLKWVNNALTCIWQTTGSIASTTGSGVSVGNNAQVFAYADSSITDGYSLVLSQPGVNFSILTWADSSLNCYWTTSTAIPGNNNEASWSLSANDQLVIADIDGDGADEIMMFQVSAQLAVAKCQGGVIGIISYLTTSQSISQDCISNLYCVYAVDLGSTGTVKITIGTTTSNLYVITWNGGIFSLIWSCQSEVPGTNDNNTYFLLFGGSGFFGMTPEVLYPLYLSDAGFGFLAYSSAQTGIFEWQNNGLVCSWLGTTANDVNNWGFTSYNYPITIQNHAQVLLAFAPNASIAILSVSSTQFTSVYQSTMAKAWNTYFLANLPNTAFTAFTGNQLSVYQYVSLNVTPSAPGPSGTGDIRYEYSNTNDAGTFSSWSSQIDDMPIGPNFSVADWQAITSQLAKETGWVGVAYTMNTNACSFANLLQNQQALDMAHCFDNMSLVQATSTNQTPYWADAIVDAVIWGLAACPLGTAAQVCLAVGASLYGSYASEPTSSAPETTVEYQDFATVVNNLFLEAATNNYLSLASIVTDQVKLELSVGLAESAWYWSITDFTSLIGQGSNYNRIAFYKMLIPAQFTMFTWTNYPLNSPSAMWGQGFPCSASLVDNVPSYASGVQNGSGSPPSGYNESYNIWMLAQGSMNTDELGETTGYSIAAYPEQALMNDLFNILQVQPWDLYNGAFNWSTIPQAPNVIASQCIWSQCGA